MAQLVGRPETQVKQVICLVRGESVEAATARVRKALSARGLSAPAERYSVVVARLGKTQLGMGDAEYDQLVKSVDVIIHVSRLVTHIQERS